MDLDPGTIYSDDEVPYYSTDSDDEDEEDGKGVSTKR